MKHKVYFLFLLYCFSFTIQAQEVVPLWSNENIPNYQKSEESEFIPKRNIIFIQKVQKPSLEIYLPAKQNSNGKAILILPGGGYSGVAYDWEGTDYAKWLNSQGFAAFVLKYRMPQAASVITSYKAPIQDAQRAMRYIRYHSERFYIQKNQVGVIGSSAGGHLASTLGTHVINYYTSKDDIDKEAFEPDFMMLIYPVISMESTITHSGSRNELLGISPNIKLIQQFSNELNVNKNTPQTFIIHSGNDKVVPIENSIRFYQKLIKHNVPTTMHIFPNGGHGYSLGLRNSHAPDWTSLANDWLKILKTTSNE
ncbi:alpha/beta hydrolase [Urechidicola sp. KH5]